LDHDFYTILSYQNVHSFIERELVQNVQVIVSFSSLETISYFVPTNTKRKIIGQELISQIEHPYLKMAPSFLVKFSLMSSSVTTVKGVNDPTMYSARASKLLKVSQNYPKIVNGCNNPLFAEGTFWSPEMLNLLVVSSVFKGSWMFTFLQRIVTSAGNRLLLHRVAPEHVPPSLLIDGDLISYGDLIRLCCDQIFSSSTTPIAASTTPIITGQQQLQHQSRPSIAHIWGVFKNYTSSTHHHVTFRGVILSPHKSFKVSLANDRVFICLM
jgi:hypothetical protein